MKRIYSVIACTIILFSSSQLCFAQDDQPETYPVSSPKWLSKTGYWVTVSNIHQPGHHTIYFYNNDNVLVYKETVDGVALNLDKRKTKMRLKKLVDQTVATYQQKQELTENQLLVITRIKKQRGSY